MCIPLCLAKLIINDTTHVEQIRRPSTLITFEFIKQMPLLHYQK